MVKRKPVLVEGFSKNQLIMLGAELLKKLEVCKDEAEFETVCKSYPVVIVRLVSAFLDGLKGADLRDLMEGYHTVSREAQTIN